MMQNEAKCIVVFAKSILNNIVVPDQCISVIFCSVCLLYDYLRIFTIVFSSYTLTNIFEQQKNSIIEETILKSTTTNHFTPFVERKEHQH